MKITKKTIRENYSEYFSPLTSHFSLQKSLRQGFTLIELILVIAMLLVLGTMGTAYAARFLTQNAVDNTTDQFVSSYRKAQLNAIMGKQNSNWGVNYATKVITLYKGNTFATRVAGFDETYTVNAGVNISGASDINFTRVTGIPSATPTVIISGNGSTNTVTVNSQGVVSR